jgi:hypothetical protein
MPSSALPAHWGAKAVALAAWFLLHGQHERQLVAVPEQSFDV